MGIFDDIFEGIDDITSTEVENEIEKPEKKKLGISEAEKKMGMWNAQDDGNAWTSDPGDQRSSGGNKKLSKKSFNDLAKSPHPTIGPLSNKESSKDDWAHEDEILEDFVNEDEEEFESDGGDGAFDDIF